MVLWLNAHYTDSFNLFFSKITYLGDGILVAIVAIALLWSRYSHFAIVVFLGLLQLIVVQGLKRVVFASMERPAAYFSDAMPPLNFVEGVNIHQLNTLPSGHTATAFSIAFILVLLLKPNRWIASLLFLLATLVGLSRIYLAQHFLFDTLVGCAIGLGLAYVSYFLFTKLERRYPSAGFFYEVIEEAHLIGLQLLKQVLDFLVLRIACSKDLDIYQRLGHLTTVQIDRNDSIPNVVGKVINGQPLP